MGTKRTVLMTSLASAVLAASMAHSAYAQSDADMVAEDEIVVTGFRASLASARDVKRNSDVFVDSIVSEDIAKFPDLNLAESLQRLPGVAIQREAGEGRRLTLRGLGPDFTRVQLNGMEVLGNVDSPQDSRGQRSRDRAFDFNIFASELFTRVDVTKTFSAEQNEGGLAGTVGLYTAKPFDYDGFTAAVSFQGGTNTATEDFQPRFAGLISNNWGDFGALFSIAYSERETEEQGYNTYRWRPRNADGSDLSALSQADQDAINNSEYFFPRGNRLSVWASEQERLGITTALQWRPSDTFELTLDVLYGEFSGDRDELHLASRGGSSTWLGGDATVDGVAFPNSVVNEIGVNAANEVVYLDVSGANTASETRRQTADNTFEQVVLSGKWNPTDRLAVTALIGTESSDYDMPISDKFYMENFGDVISIYDGFDARNIYGWDTTDPANWRAHEIDLESVYQSSSFDTAKVDVAYDFSDTLTVKTGLSYQKFENEQSRYTIGNLLRSDWQDGVLDDDVSAYAQVFTDHDAQDWLIVDFDAALAQYGVDRDALSFNTEFEVGVEEETTAGYVQLDWNTELSGLNFRGNLGGRFYSTDVTALDFEAGTSSSASYDGFLPAVNLALELSDELVLRAAFAQNINRLGLGSLAPVTYSISESSGEVTVGQGSDPSLDPFTSDNFDISLEYYFGDVGLVAFGVFHKVIDGYVGSETITNVAFGDTGADLADLETALDGSGITASNDLVVTEFTRPINYNESDLTGFELSAQADFTFLPAPFDKLGFVGNYTYLDGEFEYATPNELADGASYLFTFPGLSENNFNATLYYETDVWGARIAANYRDEWVQSGRPTGSDEDSRGFNETTYVDFSAFYNVNERLKVTFEGVNLTDEREEQWSDSARRLYNVTEAGSTYFIGANYRF